MIKRLLFLLIILCGLVCTEKTWAGSYSIGSTWNLSIKTVRPIWGIRGYIAISPNTLYQATHGVIYHTHTDGSRYGPETYIHYNDNNHLGLKFYRWSPPGRNWIDVIKNGSGTQPGEDSFSLLISNGTGTIESAFSKYVTDLAIGTETKKVIYFDQVSVFQDFPGTTTGTWRCYTRIKNFNNGIMDMKWHYQFNGTIQENVPVSYLQGYWAGAFETFNTVGEGGAGTPMSSSSNSGGNYLMDFIAPNGQWGQFDTISHTLRTSDGSNTGFAVYNPGSSPGAWLGKVP